ncbi:MAG: serine/threonine protein kinase [Planctomycetes bacterium]|nr:serine/threonine protein kinase [Planctomycetota bacterium]
MPAPPTTPPPAGDSGGDSAFDRLRALFDRAIDLPPAEREAFLRHESTADPRLRDAVLSLIAHAAEPTPHFELPATADASLPDEERVRAAATAELLERLSKQPRLDAERFVSEGSVASGGQGNITALHDRQLERRVAMKTMLASNGGQMTLLDSQRLARFLEEAQVTSQLDHPGVVPVHELGLDHAGHVYFTMRLVRGRAADEVFADIHAGRGDWTLMRGLEVILKVCDTMAYAHAKGVLHRDLKPRNIMVGRFGEVYVVDWGLAKLIDRADHHDAPDRPPEQATIRADSARRRDGEGGVENPVVTMGGQRLGTPSYMPPEQARGEPVDGRADVYAIGAMMYELVTGRAPYTVPGVRADAYRIVERVIAEPPQPIAAIRRDVPPELVAIIDKAMARRREDRHADPSALAADLRAYLDVGAIRRWFDGRPDRSGLFLLGLGTALAVLLGGTVSRLKIVAEAELPQLWPFLGALPASVIAAAFAILTARRLFGLVVPATRLAVAATAAVVVGTALTALLALVLGRLEFWLSVVIDAIVQLLIVRVIVGQRWPVTIGLCLSISAPTLVVVYYVIRLLRMQW